ncbi:hypothetical protein MD535_00100 [Vibrio sp. ZSDZ65]|uniref:Uncharacterized protein n=1 Tax=Vibrio qingdaonensis TaxID=2829491 RepID=A0A9X3CJ67_9VIBR|nr:hypothetical protein [Vibrio qingdaonensis]MCW8344427.1 hypothetical protein [Vibrio qingdaonensis]
MDIDWQAIASVAAVLALLLSQLPPISSMIRNGNLIIERGSFVSLTTGFGTPNMAIYVVLKNAGGRLVNIQKLRINVKTDHNNSFSLDGAAYYLMPTDTTNVHFNPVEIKSGEIWNYNVNFYELWGRTMMRDVRKLSSTIREDIQSDLMRAHAEERLGSAKASDVEHLHHIFEKNFKWLAGEYEATIEAIDRDDNVLALTTFEFTIFESESEELLNHKSEYKYGYGVCLPNSSKQSPLVIQLKS